MRVNEMVDAPHYSASDIGQVLGKDPGLTARLLKIVNSPFYGFPARIDTISRAITIVGTRELRDLVLATTVVRLFAGLPNDLVSMDSFWRHSTFCALITRLLAARSRELNIERFFVAGLLHDIGSLLLYRKTPELAREALLRSSHSGEVLQESERKVLGFDHTDVGAELMRKWRLPKNIEEAVQCHHAPRKAQQFQKEAAAVHLANIITTALNHDNPEPGAITPLDPLAWEILELSTDDIEPVIDEAEQQFADFYSLLFNDEKSNRSSAK